MRIFFTQKSLDRFVAEQTDEVVDKILATHKKKQAHTDKTFSIILHENVKLRQKLYGENYGKGK